MKRLTSISYSLILWLVFVFTGGVACAHGHFALQKSNQKIRGAKLINATTVELFLDNDKKMFIDFYGEAIFRLFQDNSGGQLRRPEAKPDAKILVDNPRKPVSKIELKDEAGELAIFTAKTGIVINKTSGLFKLTNRETNAQVAEQVAPINFSGNRIFLTLKADTNEYFYGGGVQNGRFSHKGKQIAIENQNSWTDGGVASPTPFYWSTQGYGLMFYTFKKGKYDFGAEQAGRVVLSHETPYLDVFFMVGDDPEALLSHFYQLTGNPVLLPKFAFYQGHLNAYNRDFWKADEKGISFENGKRYSESQKDNGGVKESLNGENNNYQFSARAVIDRYKAHDMPLGWVLPNDGYGAGYGQAATLDGNIANLKSFGDYARKNGVEIGLWTQSDLHPKDSIGALLQRDIIKEVRDAGVRVLKTDVAWVGAGYSFGLNGVADVGAIMPKYGHQARPFIISLDGWAGTQRYAGIWSGDQTGGDWEYIRFHIPTYIGSGLSGQPNISSDMDGIFGGKNVPVNVRDFEWKTFTPMQLNMDGWGANPKYPHILGEPATSINRTYLKLKAALMPYTYSIAKEAIIGMPMVRAMFLQTPNAYTLGTATQYQFMYGPSFLVAPIYQATKADSLGNDIRNGIYLPPGTWVDYFSGDKYEGNRIINNFDAPLWKLPLFVKNGAIIPMANPHNNVQEIDKSARAYQIYGNGKISFIEYDDDGKTEAYKNGKGTTTAIATNTEKGSLTIVVKAAQGDFEGFVREKSTTFVINVSARPKKITAVANGKKIRLTAAKSKVEFEKNDNVFYYDGQPNLNRFATKNSGFEKVEILKNPQLWVKLGKIDITKNELVVAVKGFVFNMPDRLRMNEGGLVPPLAKVLAKDAGAFFLTPSWQKVANADYYEIDFNNMIYSTIKDTALLFDNLKPDMVYDFKIRSVNKTGVSNWASFSAKTSANPLQYAIKGIKASNSVADQGGADIDRMFNFDEADGWHTKWSAKATPFDVVLDLKSLNKIEKIEYLPRMDAGNGTITHGSFAYSEDRINWIPAGSFSWARNNKTKVFPLKDHPTVRYIKFHVDKGSGNFGSGREMYVYKVAGSKTIIPGDINNDQKIDENDLTSYMNYTGLRKGDGDFDGYVSVGDINKNNLIDAFDMANVATQLNGGANKEKISPLAGKISLVVAKLVYKEGETVEIKVKGSRLASVNAFSFALPYNALDLAYVGAENLGAKQMENFTYDRLHTNGKKALYPTFVNVGDKPSINGDVDLLVIKFKAKRKISLIPKMVDGLLVDKDLNTQKF